MDSLTYNYITGTNKLSYVRDRLNNSSTHSSYLTVDIDDQFVNNYQYDAIGNLIRDSIEGIRLSVGGIKWNVYGKITEINKVDSSKTLKLPGRIKKISYYYDAAGNRIGSKTEKYSTTAIAYTWYVRDASGNVMSVYSYSDSLRLTEQHLYGSSRLGILTPNINMQRNAPAVVNMAQLGSTGNLNIFTRGNKLFELSNHLGNVLVTLSDKKKGIQNGTTGTVLYYLPMLKSAQDYYPGGMIMPGRKFNGGYRYGFNGKENDNEVKGEGNQQDYGERIYDPRLGRFLSVDPISRTYPMLTPYQFASNRPIDGIDLDGEEEKIVINEYKDGKEISTKVLTQEEIKKMAPTLPKELAVIPNVGIVTIDRNKFSGIFQENYDFYSYENTGTWPRPEIKYTTVYSNWLSQVGHNFNEWSAKNMKAGGYGVDVSTSLNLGLNNVGAKPLGGEVKLTNSARTFQSNAGQFQLNNNLNLSGAVNYSASANEKIGSPSLNLTVKPEVYGYMFFGSKTNVPNAGDMSFESTTSIKIGPLKIETTNSSTGNFEFKLGMTNKFGFEFKSAPAKEKVVLTSNSGTISY